MVRTEVITPFRTTMTQHSSLTALIRNRSIMTMMLVILLAGALCKAKGAAAEIHKFKPDQPGTRNLGIWRLTHDPAIRKEANYHNIQCWSPNGRYTCYTKWGGNDVTGGKASAEIHVVDLSTGIDRFVGKGINPRWANAHNWLFFCQYTGDGKPPYETGTQLIRYDADSGEELIICHGLEVPGGTDSSDSWIFGTQRFRQQQPEYVAVRVRNEANSKIEVLKGAPNQHGHITVNPFFPVIQVRTSKEPPAPIYGRRRALFDLDGSNLRTGSILAEIGHTCWSGDGRYLLIGNRQVMGRLWNEPYPSDLHVLSWGSVGDISPCDKAGRYICGGTLKIIDTRSGDAWTVVNPYSNIVYPMQGDHSTLVDIDPKGSPDGTKIHYHSTRDIDNPIMAYVTAFDPKAPDTIYVDTTEGFPERGDLVAGCEIIRYSKKTATSLSGLTRCKYGTLPAPNLKNKVPVLFPLSAFLLSATDKARAKPDPAMLAQGLPKDHPLMYQRQTDCYIVVTRLPFQPHLRLKNGHVELIPGENHWETKGYRLLLDGTQVVPRLLSAGEKISLTTPGIFTAIAVEWSNLESPPSLPLNVEGPTECEVLYDKPSDFSWTNEVWSVGDRDITRDNAMAAAVARSKIVHLHDGVITQKIWEQGKLIQHVDFNDNGKPIRHREFHQERLSRQIYKNADGRIVSEEFFGEDGFKSEYILYDTRQATQELQHWWYKNGVPVKQVKSRAIIFDWTAEP